MAGNKSGNSRTYVNRYCHSSCKRTSCPHRIKEKRLRTHFNQLGRYQKHSFWANGGIYQFTQIFVISNGVETKYLANNKNSSFKQTTYWAKENNDKIIFNGILQRVSDSKYY